MDIFPQDRGTRYNGDCTRTVVHGEVRPEIRDMHPAVCEANAASKRAAAPGATGEDVHRAATGALTARGCALGLPDLKGPELLAGDAATIEPGLYRRDLGGVRVADIVVVAKGGRVSLNRFPEGLTWMKSSPGRPPPARPGHGDRGFLFPDL